MKINSVWLRVISGAAILGVIAIVFSGIGLSVVGVYLDSESGKSSNQTTIDFGTLTGSGSEKINDYRVIIQIKPDGDLAISESINYDFGTQSRHGIYRDIPVRFNYPKKEDTDRVYPLEVKSVTASNGASAQYETSDLTRNGIGYERIKIGDPDRTITGAHTYDIKYRVQGALNGFPNQDELYWNAIGTEWLAPITNASVQVIAPAAVLAAACYQGSYGSDTPCTTATVSGDNANFSIDSADTSLTELAQQFPDSQILQDFAAQPDLFPGSGLTVAIAFPKGIVPSPKPILSMRKTLARAFSLTPLTVGLASALLVGGLVVLLLLGRRGRDRRYKGGPVDHAFGSAEGEEEIVPVVGAESETPVEFAPPDDLRPGQVGTLIDFKVQPLDVTATIVDLAVRKYLVIEDHGSDWKFIKKAKATDDLKPYELALLDGIFQSGDEVLLSSLKKVFAARLNKVKKALSADAKKEGWFLGDPAALQRSIRLAGIGLFSIGIVVTILLGNLTRLALLGVPLILLGILVVVSARWAPARTAKGYSLLRRVDGFRRFIEESEKDRARFAEKQNLFSEYLPYAVVFGTTEKWARTFEGLTSTETDDLYWYRSSTPFRYLTFAHTVNGFTNSTSGVIVSTPPSASGSSGFSGGSSGGGGGGGGGGSW
ncbi:unannotated protein [freshwater metagenome]|uniref:Unannotated protein n=1 Tax=freshwater metagenome TaxID=449393 RepID=A0A6J6RVF7_9ZZZZ|nr:DUF2207 domain-containing protein [Actinomycetota bacterium]